MVVHGPPFPVTWRTTTTLGYAPPPPEPPTFGAGTTSCFHPAPPPDLLRNQVKFSPPVPPPDPYSTWDHRCCRRR